MVKEKSWPKVPEGWRWSVKSGGARVDRQEKGLEDEPRRVALQQGTGQLRGGQESWGRLQSTTGSEAARDKALSNERVKK